MPDTEPRGLRDEIPEDSSGGVIDRLSEHVADREGIVWRIVRDGGMATRAHQTGIQSIGINTLRRERGPLRALVAVEHQRPTCDPPCHAFGIGCSCSPEAPAEPQPEPTPERDECWCNPPVFGHLNTTCPNRTAPEVVQDDGEAQALAEKIWQEFKDDVAATALEQAADAMGERLTVVSGKWLRDRAARVRAGERP